MASCNTGCNEIHGCTVSDCLGRPVREIIDLAMDQGRAVPGSDYDLGNSSTASLWLRSQHTFDQQATHYDRRSLSSVSNDTDHGDAVPLRSLNRQARDSHHDPLLHSQDLEGEVHDRRQSLTMPSGTAEPVIPRKPIGSQPRRSHYEALAEAEDNDGDTHDSEPEQTPQKESEGRHIQLWRPYTLRRPFLVTTLVIAVVLGLVCTFLLVYSAENKGLGADQGSSATLFGWRFAPTLVAVLYTLLTTAMFNDVRRTEAFAQMSHPTGASSASSILLVPGQWWNVLSRSLKKGGNHGHINIFVLAAVLVNVISFLLINPLSSALLQSQPVDLTSKQDFQYYQVNADHPVDTSAGDLTYFRTIGHVLQNLSTSAWITDKYVVVPFWPSQLLPDLGISLSPITQRWQADTTVMSAELQCEEMSIQKGRSEKDIRESGEDELETIYSLMLSDTHGCDAGIEGYQQYITEAAGGGSLFKPPDFVTPVWDNSETISGSYNSTPQCAERSVLLVTNGYWDWGDNATHGVAPFTGRAWSCGTYLYSANLSVEATSSTNGTTLRFDEAEYTASKRVMEGDLINQTRLETAFLARNWTSMIYTASPSTQPAFGGPSVLLAGLYNFDPVSMMRAPSLLNNTERLLQRFFGEAVLANIPSSPTASRRGNVVNTQRKVVVNLPIAIPLAVLFLTSAVLMAAVLLFTRQHPLDLTQDPSSVAAVVRLIEHNPQIRDRFMAWNRDKGSTPEHALGEMQHYLRNGSLTSIKNIAEHTGMDIHDCLSGSMLIRTGSHSRPTKRRLDWRPFTVRKLGGGLLLLLLALVLSAILVLYVLAKTSGLYESAFTYQTSILPSKSDLFTFAPYSIIPTFLAVIVSLWWDNVDDTFRRLQPFVAMAQRIVPVSPNVGLSYIAAYPIWTTIKALRHRHWIVALVSAGAILAQILTVSMSALWQRADGSRPGSMNLARSFEPRSEPHIYFFVTGGAMGGGDPTGQTTLANFYGNLSTNWLYSATLELAYNGSEPGWSRDGWSFVPLDLSSIVNSALYKDTPSDDTTTTASDMATPKRANVTLTTPAMRGLLDCTPLQTENNISAWSTDWDLTNRSMWNVSHNPKGLDKGYEINWQLDLGPDLGFDTAPILSQKSTILCCANTTTSSPSAIGYWSNNYTPDQEYDFEPNWRYPRNFTMKWITGTPAPGHYLMNQTYSKGWVGEGVDFRHLIFPEPPQLSALNCRPRIETSTATITVDMSTGRVWDYKILTTPKTTNHPWTDVYDQHTYNGPENNSTTDAYGTQLTVSHGVLFQDALLHAADLSVFWPGGRSQDGDSFTEDLSDTNFNFRLRDQGLNVDLMSYTMYSLAGGDLNTLTNPTQMQALGTKVFSTFFQHFVSYNTTNGGWAYQRINATLPSNLGPITGSTYQDTNTTLTPLSDMTTTAHIDIAVEVLQMSPVAVYISLAILFVLACITIFIYVAGHEHFKNLRHGFDDLASVIAVVYASEGLRQWVRENPDVGAWVGKKAEEGGPRVSLGVFRGADGQEKWGVEIVDEGEKRGGG